MTTHHIETSRGQFYYRQFGHSNHPIVILIHGWPQSGYAWQEIAGILENEYQCLAIDLRGSGDSNRALDKELYAKDNLAKDVVTILDTLNIDKFFLAGHDWGGAVVQEIAFAIPERVEKLVILNFPIIHNLIGQKKAYKKLGERLFFPHWYQYFMSSKYLPEQLLKGNEAFWMQYVIRGITKPIKEEAIKEYTRCYQIPDTLTTSANFYRTMFADMKRWATSSTYLGKKHPMEALIIHGQRDGVIVQEYYEGIDNCFDDVSLELVDAGHFVIEEKPEVVSDLLKAFFSS